MKKNILVLLLAAGMIVFNNGCTSSETPSDEQAIENADAEKIETIDEGELGTPNESLELAEETTPAEAAPTEAAAAPSAEDDASLEAALNEPSTDSAPAPEAAPTEAPAPVVADTTSTPTIDETSLSTTTEAPAVTDAQLAPDASMPPVEDPSLSAPLTETPLVDSSSSASSMPAFSSSSVEPTPVTTSKPAAPLKKVSEFTPYQDKNGGWVNTIYVARPSEKLADISMKIFGADKSKELKAISENRYLKSRSPRGGDKIYYVSPNRPDDATRTISYYEDMGMIPETYVAKDGESLKKVAKNLLGYDNAWKEIWSTNSIESKTKLKDGETLRYWKSATGEVMAATPPSPPPTADLGGATVTETPPTATATTTPPATTDTAAADTSLPPPPADAAATMPPPPADATAAAPPPPPPVEDTAAAPPAPIDETAAAATTEEGGQAKLEEAAAEEEEGLNDDAMMSMAALGVLVALLAFVIIRKKKQKTQMNNLEMNA